MIFISYRNADASHVVSRLDNSLTAEFGRDAVYRDKTGHSPAIPGYQDGHSVAP